MKMLTPEECVAIKRAKFTVMYEGELLRVTKMYDYIGQPTSNPLRAFSCVAFRHFTKEWLAVLVHPGEIAPRRER
jgi:hypothetical protein